MKIHDFFKINMPRSKDGIIYQVVVISADADWVSAKIVHPSTLANKLRPEGVFRIHVASLDTTTVGNPNTDLVADALYG